MRASILAASVIVAILFTLGVIVWAIAVGLSGGRCLESHIEQATQSAWVQMIPSGKSFIPVHHPARTYEKEVCDRWEGDE